MSYIATQMARRGGMSAPIETGLDQGTTTRPPSTAVLAVDSLDRSQTPGSGTSANFVINKNQALFNGFFNRIALNELVLDWCIPNIGAYTENNTLTVTTTAGPTTHTITLADGHYTVADALDTIVTELNTAFGAGTFRLEDQPDRLGHRLVDDPVALPDILVEDGEIARHDVQAEAERLPGIGPGLAKKIQEENPASH